MNRRVIHKTAIPALTLDQPLRVPTDAEVLSVQFQHGRLTAWYITTQQGGPYRELMILGTGHPCTFSAAQHVATVQDGPFVWHVFDPGKGTQHCKTTEDGT